MKKSILLIFLCVLASCGGIKSPANNSAVLVSPCPDRGNCVIEVLKDKSLSVKMDDLKRPFYTVLDMPGRVVVKYTFTKKNDPKYADDGYSEEVIFETDENFTQTDADKSKLLFSVHCFCRGKAGFYKVPQGTIAYKDTILQVTLPDIVEGQLTKTITVTFK